jgi:uroporphyrinogen-III synthase
MDASLPGSAPLAGRRIVITRAEQDARKLAARLEGLGAHSIVLPSIRIEFADPESLDAALAHLSDYQWIIFTSRYAVDAVLRRTPRLPGPRVAAVGRSTADALQARGITPSIVPADFVAEALLEALGDVRGARVLLPRADIGRRELPDGLRARGAQVEEIVAYRTVAVASQRPDLSGVDAITFTSSSTVRGFLESGPVPPGAKVICMGRITAQTAREAGLDVYDVAREYTEDGLVAALVAALGK